MSKNISPEADEKTLVKKIQERAGPSESSGTSSGLRALRKRLKRTQRKRRRLEGRKRRGLGKKAGIPSGASPGGGTPA